MQKDQQLQNLNLTEYIKRLTKYQLKWHESYIMFFSGHYADASRDCVDLTQGMKDDFCRRYSIINHFIIMHT